MKHRVLPALIGLLLAACAAPGNSSQVPPSVTPSDAAGTPVASATRADSPSPAASVDASAEPAGALTVDELARTTIEGLSVRAEPSTAAERLGVLPSGETAFVLAGPVEADGYTWYRLVSPGRFSIETCTGEFQCEPWIGWAAATTPEGDRWLAQSDPDCPPGRDTTTYLSVDALTRLACAGDEEWRLVGYLAPPGGRGCFPVWFVDPGWMDPSCSFFFPQPVESELDVDASLRGFIPPGGVCEPGGCPDLRGSWVEIVGHLDDPVAETCTYVFNSQVAEAPSPPPDSDLAVFGCRLNFVVTAITATTPPD